MQDFSAISPFLKVKHSTRAKRMSLRLDAKDRCVYLIIPKRANLKVAYNFAYQNCEWIEDKLSRLPAHIPLVDKAVIPLLGRNVRIDVIREVRRSTKIDLENDRLIVRTNLNEPSRRILRHMKKLAEEKFRPIVEEKAARINRSIKALKLKDMKTRWGSCSRDGHMTLNWRLIFSPPECYDYVIAHEVAHLIHHDHGPKFWNLCEKLSWRYDDGRNWIRDNANELTRYTAVIPDP